MEPGSSTTWSWSPRRASESRASPRCSLPSPGLWCITLWWGRTCPADWLSTGRMTLTRRVTRRETLLILTLTPSTLGYWVGFGSNLRVNKGEMRENNGGQNSISSSDPSGPGWRWAMEYDDLALPWMLRNKLMMKMKNGDLSHCLTLHSSSGGH